MQDGDIDAVSDAVADLSTDLNRSWLQVLAAEASGDREMMFVSISSSDERSALSREARSTNVTVSSDHSIVD